MPNWMQCPRCWGNPHATAATCAYCAGLGVVADEQLSPHFRLSELLASQTAIRLGIPNDSPAIVLAALRELAPRLLEPVRELVGPMHVDSGYRAPALNSEVGGALSSAHRTGFAADCKPLTPGLTLREMMRRILASPNAFDQVIYEYGSWVHVALRGPGGVQRRQALMIFAGTGYLPFDASHPRVIA